MHERGAYEVHKRGASEVHGGGASEAHVRHIWSTRGSAYEAP